MLNTNDLAYFGICLLAFILDEEAEIYDDVIASSSVAWHVVIAYGDSCEIKVVFPISI